MSKELVNLNDVNVSIPVSNDVLSYDLASEKWINTSENGTPSTTLNGMSDVNTGSILSLAYLMYNGSKWDKNKISNSRVNLGFNAGNNQGNNCVAIGTDAGRVNQTEPSVSIGNGAGENRQTLASVAIGTDAGKNDQKINSYYIGHRAGEFRDPTTTEIGIGVGINAGRFLQDYSACAIGNYSGENAQGYMATAIGDYSGNNNQGDYTNAVGYEAGYVNQEEYSTAIGYRAGYLNQGSNSIAIGCEAGSDNLGNNSIAIGYKAGTYFGNSLCISCNSNWSYPSTAGFFISKECMRGVALGLGVGKIKALASGEWVYSTN